jgi:hypothetical protein
MTILVLNPPDGKYCYYHIWTNVVSCDDLYITLRSGEKIRKSLCAKVELLSVSDAPNDYNGFKDFTDALVREFANQCGFEFGSCYANIGKKENFENLELLTHI